MNNDSTTSESEDTAIDYTPTSAFNNIELGGRSEEPKVTKLVSLGKYEIDEEKQEWKVRTTNFMYKGVFAGHQVQGTNDHVFGTNVLSETGISSIKVNFNLPDIKKVRAFYP